MSRLLKGLLVGLLVGVFLAPAPAPAGGGCHRPPVADASGSQVDMKNACFTPSVLRIAPGDTVTWTNRDDFGHVVVGVGWSAAEDFNNGDSASLRFDEEGIYSYSCYLHPGMNGVVIVGDPTSPADSSILRVPSAAIVDSKVGTGAAAAKSSNLAASKKNASGGESKSSTLPIALVAMTLSGSAGYFLGKLLNRRPE